MKIAPGKRIHLHHAKFIIVITVIVTVVGLLSSGFINNHYDGTAGEGKAEKIDSHASVAAFNKVYEVLMRRV